MGKSDNDIPEEIMLLVLRQWDDDLSDEEKARLSSFFEENPVAQQKWESLSPTLKVLEQVGSKLEKHKLSDIKMAALLSLEKKRSEFGYWLFYGIAASLFFAMVGSLYFYAYHKGEHFAASENQHVAYKDEAAAKGELSDEKDHVEGDAQPAKESVTVIVEEESYQSENEIKKGDATFGSSKPGSFPEHKSKKSDKEDLLYAKEEKSTKRGNAFDKKSDRDMAKDSAPLKTIDALPEKESDVNLVEKSKLLMESEKGGQDLEKSEIKRKQSSDNKKMNNSESLKELESAKEEFSKIKAPPTNSAEKKSKQIETLASGVSANIREPKTIKIEWEKEQFLATMELSPDSWEGFKNNQIGFDKLLKMLSYSESSTYTREKAIRGTDETNVKISFRFNIKNISNQVNVENIAIEKIDTFEGKLVMLYFLMLKSKEESAKKETLGIIARKIQDINLFENDVDFKEFMNQLRKKYE